MFYIWYWVGCCIGVIQLKFNHKTKSVKTFKYSKVCTLIFGISIVVGFPYSYWKFFHSVQIVRDEMKYSFSMIAATLCNIFTYIGTVLFYYTIFTQGKSVLAATQKIFEIKDIFCSDPEDKQQFLKYRIFCFASILLNIGIIVTQITSLTLLVDSIKFSKIDITLFILPQVSTSIIENQYLIAILTIDYFLVKIQERLKNPSLLWGDCHVNLEKNAQIYGDIFQVSLMIERMFSIQILFLIGGCFLSVLSQTFYQSLLILFPTNHLDEDHKFRLQIVGCSSIFVQALNSTLHILPAAYCMKNVSRLLLIG